MNAESVCRVPGCGRRIASTVVMCRADWLRLPQAVRDRVLAEQSRGGGSLEYWAAVDLAVEWHIANPAGGQMRLGV